MALMQSTVRIYKSRSLAWVSPFGLAIWISLVAGCSEGPFSDQAANSPEPATEGRVELEVAEDASGMAEDAMPAERRSQESDAEAPGAQAEVQFTPVPLQPSSQARGRMLEYQVNLLFTSKSVLNARKTVLQVANEYGFLASARTSLEEREYFQATIRVDSDRLYDALQDLQGIGELENEQIDVIDHTADMVWQSIRLDREQLRGQRRRNLQNRTTPQNQIQAENLISGSEDAEDQAKFEKWKLEDRIKWATIHLTIQGPKTTIGVEVPAYQNALIGLANTLLSILYWMLENIIWVILLALLAWKWPAMWRGARRLVGKDQP
jgi:hypothetical protein